MATTAPARAHSVNSKGCTSRGTGRSLGSRVASLNQDYHLGRRCGRYFLATLGQWLNENTTLTSQQPVIPPAPVANEPVRDGVILDPLAGNDADYDEGSLA